MHVLVPPTLPLLLQLQHTIPSGARYEPQSTLHRGARELGSPEGMARPDDPAARMGQSVATRLGLGKGRVRGESNAAMTVFKLWEGRQVGREA
jgi:hypothetical protein